MHGCTGALVERQWVLTAAQCFGGQATAPATVTVGTAVLSATTVVPHPERDVTLVRKLFSYANTGRSGLSLLDARVEIGRSSWQTMAELAGGDLTGDGRQDLLAVVAGSGATLLYPGDGTGTSDVAAHTVVRLIG